jgi:hypothetical protein
MKSGMDLYNEGWKGFKDFSLNMVATMINSGKEIKVEGDCMMYKNDSGTWKEMANKG